MHTLASLVLLLLSSTLAAAQFQFFEQMFGGGGGGQQHHQQQQNMPSDSAWYQTQYEAGMFTPKKLTDPLVLPL